MYENLKDTLCEELEKYDRRGEMSAGELEAVHKLTDTIKNLYKIDMYEEYGDSYADYDDDMSSRHYVRGHYSRENRGSYGDSYNRGSYARGRRGGYSYAETVDQLKELMQGADEKEKAAIKKAIQQIEK